MGWIGIAGGNAMVKVPKSPYTPAEYNQVLAFFNSNKGSFFKISKIAQLNSLPVNTTQAIVAAQVADPTTGVTTNPKSESEFGIPKKKENKGKK